MSPAAPRLLSVDLDGTVVFDGRMGQRDLEALGRWRDAGNLLVLNTGRSLSALRQVLPEAETATGGLFDYAILYTGAVLTDSRLRVLTAETLPDGVLEDLLARLEGQEGVSVFATTLEGDLLLHDSLGSTTLLLSIFTPGTLEELAGRRLIGVPVRLSDDALALRIVEYIERRWAGRATAFRNQDFVDIVPAGASKGAALLRLLGDLQAPHGPFPGQRIETISIGDSWNDIPMHKAADTGYALPWSPQLVADHCRARVGGLAELVDRLLQDQPAAQTRGPTSVEPA